MSLNACAALVERSDADRFRAIMAAPVAARPVLFAIYAFNVEVTRAPWVTKEEMIAEMRLQWWRRCAREEIAGRWQVVRKHEVVDALRASSGRSRALRDLDAARSPSRRWDVYTDAFEDRGASGRVCRCDDQSGHLLWTAARSAWGARTRLPCATTHTALAWPTCLRAVP